MNMDDFDVERFKQKLFSGEISRRQLGKILAAAGIVATTVPLASRAIRAEEGHPIVYTWAGYDVPDMYPTYVEKYGEAPQFSLWTDEEEAITKIRGGFQPDTVFPCSYKVQRWYDAGILAPIDLSKIAHVDDIFPALRSMDVIEIGGETVWLPIDWGQTSVLYRTDLAPEYVDNESWEILWDPKYAGRLSNMGSLIDGMAVASIVLGLEDPFTIEGEDMERVKAKLVEQKDLLRFYADDPTTIEQALASGEVVAATAWNQSYAALLRQGLPVKFMNPKEGAMTWVCGMSIVANAPNPERAHEVISAMLDPRSRAWEMTEYGYGSSTQEPYTMVDPAILEELGMPSDPTELLESGIFQAPMTPEPELQQMYEEVKAGV
ncbi:MAG: extracellular solute-binding protein [Dongiaceae bacterium]